MLSGSFLVLTDSIPVHPHTNPGSIYEKLWSHVPLFNVNSWMLRNAFIFVAMQCLGLEDVPPFSPLVRILVRPPLPGPIQQLAPESP